MIGKLTGKLDAVFDDHILIDVNGVGYIAFCSARTMRMLPDIGGMVSLIIETHVREDHIHLYGFGSAIEREWFKILTTVQGVGVKMGMAILGHFSPEQIINCIAAQDKKALTQVSGVGPKLAERIVVELKSTVGKMVGSTTPMVVTSDKPNKKSAASSMSEDAISALVHLGYQRADAFTAVARVLQQKPEAKLDQLIRDGLKELAA
ncbi:MAG: Holliday junction branch migration protein RuvA [Alphaproteobacteria bacterium]|nr:Holliday junction branch migration protein RuvA [Alphaproteobacteria bacterium]